jgi:hypothetical protein
MYRHAHLHFYMLVQEHDGETRVTCLFVDWDGTLANTKSGGPFNISKHGMDDVHFYSGFLGQVCMPLHLHAHVDFGFLRKETANSDIMRVRQVSAEKYIKRAATGDGTLMS